MVGSRGVMLVLQGRGVSARPEPSGDRKARRAVHARLADAADLQGIEEPGVGTEENFVAAREHFADHCASCHANDGSGNTEMGRNLYPKAPTCGCRARSN